jgi:hypothetical protein
MNYKVTGLIAIMMFFVLTPPAYAQDWLWKIVPLKTNISEVKKMFAVTPEMYGNNSLEFILEEGVLTIDFSPSKCAQTSWGSWNVEPGAVIDVIFYPDKGRKPSFYNLKPDGMKQGFDQGHITYSSDELGLYYSVEFGKVSRIHIYPANKYKSLKCEEKQAL